MKTSKRKFVVFILLVSIPFVFLALKFMEPSGVISLVFLAVALMVIAYQFSTCLRSINFNAYEDARKMELAEERRRAGEAKEKFNIPLIGHIQRSMYREGWFYSIAVILLILIGILLRFHALGDFDFRDDEYFHFSSAVGYLKTGEFVRWNFLDDSSGEECTNAWPFTWQIAQSFKIFEVSRFSGRLVSFLWSIFFLPLIYLITKRITGSKKVALLALLLIAVDSYFIFLSRWMRKYQMFVVLFFLMAYFFYRGFEYRYKGRAGDNKVMRWFYRNDINPLYLLLSITILFISLNVHILSLLFPLGVIFYALLMSSQKFLRSKRLEFDKYLTTIVLSSMALILLLFSCSFFGLHMPLYGILNNMVFNFYTQYIVNMTLYLLGSFSIFIGAFFVFGLIYALLGRSRILLYYLSLMSSGLIVLIFFFYPYRAPNPRYLSGIMPFMYIFASVGFIAVMEFFSSNVDAKRRKLLWLMFTIFIIFSCSTIFLEYKNLDLIGGYVKSREFGDFKTVSEYLGGNYAEGEIVLDIASIDYYLRDYRDKNIDIVFLDSHWDDLHMDVLDYHKRYESGWMIFERRKHEKFNRETLLYIRENFNYVEELHDTNIDVYRW